MYTQLLSALLYSTGFPKKDARFQNCKNCFVVLRDDREGRIIKLSTLNISAIIIMGNPVVFSNAFTMVYGCCFDKLKDGIINI